MKIGFGLKLWGVAIMMSAFGWDFIFIVLALVPLCYMLNVIKTKKQHKRTIKNRKDRLYYMANTHAHQETEQTGQ